MQNRRKFLKNSSLLLAGSLVAPSAMSAVLQPTASSKNIGLQLYSLRQMINSQGIQAVLEAVAQIGYTNLETAGYGDGKVYGLSPADFKKRVADLGMKVSSAHLGQSYKKEKDAEVMSWWDQAIEAHVEMGATYLVQPSMPVNHESPLSLLSLYCDYFNKVGEKATAAGLKFGFHNHSGEFKKIDDHVILDYLIDHTEQDLVMFELDVYWCQVGGANPVEYLKRYPARIQLTHIKDEKEIGASGKMDFKPIFKQMNANGIADWYVEIEQYTNNDPLESALQSYNFLNKAGYVK